MTVKNGYYKEKKPLKRIKEHCRNFTAFLFSNVGIIILVVFYTIGGAFMFREIEVSQSEHTMKHFGERNVKKIAKRLWTETVINVLNEKDFKTRINATLTDFQTTLFKSHLAGVGVNITQQWSFSGAFLYSLTVITTIGYGNISPKSIWGKLVTILYAIIGMPLFLLYLSNIGDILAKSFKWIYAKVFLCRICPGVTKRRIMREHLKIKAMALELMDLDDYSIDEELNLEMENLDIQKDSSTVTVPITVSLTIIIGYILFGAFLFHRWEDWDMLNGSYFCFISLSSIGFGDIVPGDKVINGTNGDEMELSFILCAIYLLLGMALIAMCFNLMQEQVIHEIRKMKLFFKRCCTCATCR